MRLIDYNICYSWLFNFQANIDDHDEQEGNRLNKDFVSGVLSPGRHVRTRLYFTSESHIHSLLTLLRYGGLCDGSDEQWERKPSKLSKLNDTLKR